MTAQERELIERARLEAKRESEVSRMMAQSKSLRQAGPPRDDLYMWSKPEETNTWKLADALESSIAEVGRLTTLASKLVAKLDECAPHVSNMAALQYARSGTQYTGPSYGDALEELRAALSLQRRV